MAGAVTLARFYAGEMLRLVDASAVSPELKQAETLLKWWQEQPDTTLHLATIYQRGPNSLRTAVAARKAMELLVEHGWLSRLEPGTVIDGSPRKEAWALVP